MKRSRKLPIEVAEFLKPYHPRAFLTPLLRITPYSLLRNPSALYLRRPIILRTFLASQADPKTRPHASRRLANASRLASNASLGD